MNFSDSTEPIEPTDIEFFKLAGLVPDASVSIQSGTFDLSKYPATVSLLACSSKHGHFSAASTTGFVFGQTKALRSTFYKTEKGSVSEFEDKITVSLENPVRHIRYSAEEDKLLIALPDGELLVYSVDDIQANKDQVKPIYTYQLGKDILDLRPNPEALPNLAAVLFEDHRCIIIDITTGETQATLPSDNITAMCWSPKGKQIVCGKRDGGLQHFDVQGASKDALAIPEEMKAGYGEEQEDRYVQDVLWIENHIFLVMYARPRHNLEEDDFINDGYIINRKPTKDSNEPVYIRLAEITPIFGTDGRGNHFYMEIIRDLGKEIKHLVILANAATAEISFVGETDDGTWSTWQVNDGLLNFPLSKETCMDTYPMGLALDFSADEKLPPIDAGDNDTSVEPVPVLYYLNDEGLLGAHHCYNTELARRGESYKSTAQTPTQTTSATTIAAPSAFGSTSSSGGSFADLLSGKTSAHSSTSGGFGSFGSAAGGALPSFSNLGSAPKVPSSGFGGLSSFGNASNPTTPTASKPAFGSTTGFGATAGTSTPTSSTASFGGFGTSKSSDANQKPSDKKEETEQKKTETPAFGSTTSLGSGGFGALAKNTVADAKSPAPAFGSTTSLGSGGFGALAKNTVPDAKSPAPAFGSTTSLGSGGFGALAKNTVPDAKSPAPAFGSTSSLGSGGFGALAKNTVAGAKSPAPAFGSTSSLGSGGFGALAKNTVPDAKSPAPAFGSTTSLGSGGFGALAKNTVAGAKSPTSAPLFTSSTATSSGFGSTSSFGSLTKTTAPESTATKVATPTATTASTITSTPSATTAPIATTTPATTTTPTTAATLTTTTSSLSTAAKTTPSTLTTKPITPTLSSSTLAKPASTENTNTPPPNVKPASLSKPAATSSDSTSAKTASLEKDKPKMTTVEDGMAKQYESLYLIVDQDIQELKKYQQKLSLMMKSNTTNIETKTKECLAGEDKIWNLSDAAQVGVISDSLLADARHSLEDMSSVETEVNKIVQNCKATMDKKEDIAFLLNKEVDHNVVDIMDNRDLDEEAKTLLRVLESRSEACSHSLNHMEYKFQESKRRNKIRNDHHNGQLSLYSLHRAVRDVERELVSKSKDITELETKLAEYRLIDSRQKARRMQLISDDEEEEEEEEAKVTTESIQHTTRYLRRYNFMDHVCGQASAQKPVEAHVRL